MAERGIYPAVDPLDSTSRIMDPNVIGAEHYGVARGVQKILQVYSGAVMNRQTVKVNRRVVQFMSSVPMFKGILLPVHSHCSPPPPAFQLI